MTEESIRTDGPLEERRVRFDQAVNLRYPLFQEFIEEHAANLSMGGMFIRTLHPRSPGSVFHFEFRLEDGFTLVNGDCEVAWVRDRSEGPGRPEGMGVRFLDLDLKSYKLIRTIVEQRLNRGAAVFDLERDAPGARGAAKPEEGAVEAPRADEETDPAVATTESAEASPDERSDPGDGGAASEDRAVSVPESAEPAPPDSFSPPGAAPPTAEAPASPTPGVARFDAPPGALVPPKPFTVSAAEPPAKPPASAAEPPVKVPAAAAPGKRRREVTGPVRIAALALLSAGVGGLAVLLFQQAYVEPAIEVLEPVEEIVSQRPAGPPPTPAPAAPEPASSPPVGEQDSEADRPREAAAPQPAAPAETEQRIDPAASPSELSSGETAMAWAASWSAQDVDRYLSFYASDFRPGEGRSREEWEEMRRVRVARPQRVQVTVLLLISEDTGPDEAKVSFVQVYESDRFADRVRKTLLMVREDGAWKIREERVER